MRKTIIQSLFLFVVLTSLSPTHSSNELLFEGVVSFIQKSSTDTTYFAYSVKDDKIRVDGFDRAKKMQKSLIVNIKNQKKITLNHTQKRYIKKTHVDTESRYGKKSEFVIEKKDGIKRIRGYKCAQWIVKNKNSNTVITYWVAKINMDFFRDFIQSAGTTEKMAYYFMQIPNPTGFFPLEIVERSNLFAERQRFTVLGIEKKELNDSIFKIPSGYSRFPH